MAEKLDMDFPGKSGRHESMDDDDTELFSLLCTRIGMIMEDASVIALTIGALERDARRAQVAELKQASASIAHLLAAVETLT